MSATTDNTHNIPRACAGKNIEPGQTSLQAVSPALRRVA